MQIQAEFMSSKIKVVVATVAFGMGLDKVGPSFLRLCGRDLTS